MNMNYNLLGFLLRILDLKDHSKIKTEVFS